MSNVEVVFLPANTTSKLQPLDQGTIKAVKRICRKRPLNSVLAKMDKGEDVKTVSKCVFVLDAVHWIDAAILELRFSTVKKCFLKCGIGHVDESSTSDDEDNVALNELVSRVQGHNDLSSQSVDGFVACDNDLQTRNSITTNLKIKFWTSTLSSKTRFQINMMVKKNCLKIMKQVLLWRNAAKSPLTLVRATLKCVEDIKSFLLERDGAHLLTPLDKIEKGLCKMSTNTLRIKSIRDFFIVVIKCMHIYVSFF